MGFIWNAFYLLEVPRVKSREEGEPRYLSLHFYWAKELSVKSIVLLLSIDLICFPRFMSQTKLSQLWLQESYTINIRSWSLIKVLMKLISVTHHVMKYLNDFFYWSRLKWKSDIFNVLQDFKAVYLHHMIVVTTSLGYFWHWTIISTMWLRF